MANALTVRQARQLAYYAPQFRSSAARIYRSYLRGRAAQRNRNSRNRAMVKSRIKSAMRRRIKSSSPRVVGARRHCRGLRYNPEVDQDVLHRTLKVQTFNYPDRTGMQGTDNIKRDTDTFFVKGHRLNFRFVNDNSEPVKIHFAILQHRGFCDNDNRTNTNVDNAYCKEHFFRTYQETGGKFLTFTDLTGSGSHSYTYDILPINADKWRAVTHKRFTLYGTNSNEHLNQKSFKKWMPMNKTVAFETGLDQVGVQPMIFVWWWQYIDPTINPTGHSVQWNFNQTVFFK